MSAWDEVVAKFGQPHVDVWGPTRYRVWVQHGWHVHNGASTSDPSGDGRSLESACRALLDYIARPASMLCEGACDIRCRAKYSQSEPHQKAARASTHSVIEEAAATVEKWPAWKRGLDPCTDERCERELGHKGKHRAARPVTFDEW